MTRGGILLVLLLGGCGERPAAPEADPFALLERGESARAIAIWERRDRLTAKDREGLARAWFWLGDFEKARQLGLPDPELGFGAPIALTLDPPAGLRDRAAWVTAWVAEGRRQFSQGKKDEAAAILARVQPVARDLLSLPRPPLPVLHAATEEELLHADMLRANRHWLDARFLYQKVFKRWQRWTPRSAYAEAREKSAREAIAECDRHAP